MSDDNTPDDDFQEMLRRMLGGEGAEQLQNMGVDPAQMQQMMFALQQAMNSSGDEGISWDAAKTGALHIANQAGTSISSRDRADLDQAFQLADLWLGEATTLAATGEPLQVLTRGNWVEQTLPVWQELAEPVATSVADALTSALDQQAPDEMQGMIQGASRMLRQVGGTLFANQLGQVVGKLSKEVVSGGDVGLPLLPTGTAAIVPQNFADLGDGLGIPDDQLALYFAARELAHARLFKHAKWLRLHVMSQVTDYARGIHVDTQVLEDLAERFDPSNPSELQDALQSGALLPQQSEAQQNALARLENMLALIEGWVDVVAADATSRVPSLDKCAEATRRRRRSGARRARRARRPAAQAASPARGGRNVADGRRRRRPGRARRAVGLSRPRSERVGHRRSVSPHRPPRGRRPRRRGASRRDGRRPRTVARGRRGWGRRGRGQRRRHRGPGGSAARVTHRPQGPISRSTCG
ncbi:zinc-dependent metalloprotease [Microbacterium gubbeenense]|uniref:zinc-dependent metalloprotease n=1 Tax=Microbacterium gubbeenense TaxID=159896 RepID=UPI003F94F553